MSKMMTKHGLIVLTALVTILPLSGCQAVKSVLAKRDNGSLDYANAQKLPPIQLPADQASAVFVPLYEVPAVKKATALTSNNGKQYQLPPPPQTVR